jgi:hypothetical protein
LTKVIQQASETLGHGIGRVKALAVVHRRLFAVLLAVLGAALSVVPAYAADPITSATPDTYATTWGTQVTADYGTAGADWMAIFQAVIPVLLLLLVVAFGWRFILLGFKHVVRRFRPVG